MFDSEKFNGFMKTEIDDLLFEDIWNYWIFNESDLHSAAYYYIRKYFERRQSNSSLEAFVRCEPIMEDGTKPDLVIFQRYDPIYFIEIKMFNKPENLSDDKSLADLDKLKNYQRRYSTCKWGFFILVYDSDKMYSYTPYMLKKDGYQNISIIPINMRRKEDTARQRTGYEDWRKQFDKFLQRHF